ncbi:MAG: HEAT repeat domain-containing protein, partial [Anaerolineae bacterium]|nr:HEAT repeat domain-containing protein [Anaerolineae bacterium]
MADEAKVQALLAVLDGDHWQTWLAAIQQLGELKTVEAVPRLIDLLDDAHLEIRLGTITALGKIGDVRAIPHLAAIANTVTRMIPPTTNFYLSGDEIARMMASDLALEALTRIGTPDALAVVEQFRGGQPDRVDDPTALPTMVPEAEESETSAEDLDEVLDWEEATGAGAEPPEPEPLPPTPSPAAAPPPRLVVPQPAAPGRRQETEEEHLDDVLPKADEAHDAVQ